MRHPAERELTLTEKNGDQTQNRKHVGPIPEIHVW